MNIRILNCYKHPVVLPAVAGKIIGGRGVLKIDKSLHAERKINNKVVMDFFIEPFSRMQVFSP